MQTAWDQMNPFKLVGLNADAVTSSSAAIPSVGRAAGPSINDNHRALSPQSPMFWAVAIGAVTLGLVATSTSFRVGPVRVSASAGKS